MARIVYTFIRQIFDNYIFQNNVWASNLKKIATLLNGIRI